MSCSKAIASRLLLFFFIGLPAAGHCAVGPSWQVDRCGSGLIRRGDAGSGGDR